MIRTLQIWLLIIYTLAIGGLMGFIIIKNGEVLVPSTELNIYRGTKDGFLNKDEIMKSMNRIAKLDSIKINQLQTSLIEDEIMNDPFVKSVDAFTNVSGKLIINVSEKTPLVRIFNKRSAGFYITENGNILPLRNSYSARVFVVNGFINVPFQTENTSVNDTVYGRSPLKGILKLVNTLNKNEFLKSQINQIYLNSKMEFELIPEFGKHTIIIGDLNNLDEKLQKLELFYQQALLAEGLNKYKSINLKFDGQVVCAKN